MVVNWESYLKVSGWSSLYQSVDNLLKYLRNRKSGSEGSRRLYVSTVYAFCAYVKKMPDDLVVMKRNDLEKLIEEFCHHKREAGCSAKWVNIMMRQLKSFLRVNGFKGAEEIEIETYYSPARFLVRNEYVPTLEEARNMANVAGSLRDRAMILFMFSTGLRNSTLRGILYGDIKKELENGQTNMLVKVHMGMKKIVDAACKGNIEYTVFSSAESTEALKLYLEDRQRRLGEISETEILFCSEHNLVPRNERACTVLTQRELQILVKETARKAGLKDWKNVRPHCLRKTFESILRSRLQDGSRLDVKTQEYFMGHILPGSQDTYYDKTKIEELRKEYAKLIFKPEEQGKAGVLESILVVTEALGIDSAKLLESKETELGRNMDNEEKLAFLKEATKEYIHQIQNPKTNEKNLSETGSTAPCQNTQNATGQVQIVTEDKRPTEPTLLGKTSVTTDQPKAQSDLAPGLMPIEAPKDDHNGMLSLQGRKVDHVDNSIKFELESLAAVFYRRKMSPEEMKERMAFLVGKVGMTPKEIAKETGMSMRTIYKYTPQKLKNQAMVKAGRIGGYAKRKLSKIITTKAKNSQLEKEILTKPLI